VVGFADRSGWPTRTLRSFVMLEIYLPGTMTYTLEDGTERLAVA
jgi:hypothetical protein